MPDATAKARKWARENPLTAEAAGVKAALNCAARWKKARDKLLIQQEEDQATILHLMKENEQLAEIDTLMLGALCKCNACASIPDHTMEIVREAIREAKKGKR